jgi:hypothetical protein
MPYSPADDAVGLLPDSRQATHFWNDAGAPPPVLVTVLEPAVLWLLVVPVLLGLVVVPSLAAGCDVAGDPSSDVATGAGAAAPEIEVTPGRPSGTFTFWFT